MKILNLGCGYPRLQKPFLNLDNLHSFLLPGTPERSNLDAEGNYVNHDVSKGRLPFNDNTFEGILASHFFEHFHCQDAVKIMKECFRVLRPGGVLVVSVPDASYFRKVYHQDTKENCVELFGEPMSPEHPDPNFFTCALWFNEHFGILTEDSLWAYLIRAGFKDENVKRTLPESDILNEAEGVIRQNLNRPLFSLVMSATKPL